jgi:hypothetical protein
LDRSEVKEAQRLGAVDRPLERAAVDDGCEVEQRSRQGRAGDAVLGGSVFGTEGCAAVYREVDAGARVIAGHSHVNVRASVVGQLPECRRGAMRQHRLTAHGESCRHPASLPRWRRDGEDATVHAGQPSRCHPIADGALAQSHGLHLGQGHHPVLRGAQGMNRTV